MLYCIFFFLNQLAFGNLLADDEKNLIIDFGGKFVKGGIANISNIINYLEEENDFCNASTKCRSVLNSISAAVDDLMQVDKSEDAIKIGNEAFKKVEKNNLLGIQYFGAIFNRKRSFVSENCDFFNMDSNVTISDFSIYWYLIQYFSKYSSKANSNNITIILPGYTTNKTRYEMILANQESINVNVFKDYDIIQRIHPTLFPNQSVLYLDFGAFSTKATVINRTNETVFYGFNEELGIEKVAYKQTLENNEGKVNSILNARKEAYKNISSDTFSDEDFEKDLNEMVKNSKRNINIDEIILVGGGCELPFVIKAVEKVSKQNGIQKFTKIEDVENNKNKYNHLTFLVEGCLSPVNSKKPFIYHPLYVEFKNETYGFNKFNSSIINISEKEDCEFKNESINIITNSTLVVGGTSNILRKMNISIEARSLVNNFDTNINKSIRINYTISNYNNGFYDLALVAELCNINQTAFYNCNYVPLNITDLKESVENKKLKAIEKANQTEAAMTLIRALFKSASEIRKGKKKEEL